MEKLLQWSIKAQEEGMAAPPPDPKQLAILFGAPDELAEMAVELHTASSTQNEHITLDQRIEQLESFHDHVENIDNANNIGSMWPVLIKLIDDPEPEISGLALSSIGAAVQNNRKSQLDLCNQEGAVAKIISKCESKSVIEKKQALFALSSALSHCPEVYDQFTAVKGWEVLSNLLNTDVMKGTNSALRTRVLSVFNSLGMLIEDRSDVALELKKFKPDFEKILKTEEDGSTDGEKIITVLSCLQTAKPIKLLEE